MFPFFDGVYTISNTFNALYEGVSAPESSINVIGDESRFVKSVRDYIDLLAKGANLPREQLEKIKDYKIDAGLLFEDRTHPNTPKRRKLFLMFGIAFDKNRGFAGHHAFEKHQREFRSIISSLPISICKFANENIRNITNQYLRDFEYLLLCLPFVIKYGYQLRTIDKINDICVLYNDYYTVLFKIVGGTFSGVSNYYLLTLYKPNEKKKAEFDKLRNRSRLNNTHRKK